jgi:Mn-containing catalase
MILRLDRWGVELPPPSDPDPDGAAAVQELMGGRFGEMSTFLNYTFQSFNFRDKASARPFYDLIANIAAEEFGHIELVAATINTMLTGASPTSNGSGEIAGAMAGLKSARNTQQFIPAATRLCRRTRTAGPGPATTCSPRATSWRT